MSDFNKAKQNFTDEEIITAIECCSFGEHCEKCPFWEAEDENRSCSDALYEKELEMIKRLQSENAALRNEADTNAANAIQAKLRADELEAALFTVVQNSMVMPVGLRLGKSKREITEMTFATIEEIKKAIDYDAVKKLMEGKE